MPKSTVFEQLDQAVEAILSGQERLGAGQGEFEPLARIAIVLRGLPRQDFKARLKKDLQKESIMTTAVESTTEKAAAQQQTLRPYIMHNRAPELAEFIKQAFGAEEIVRAIGSAGGFHIELRIGDASLMLGGGGKAKIDKPTPTTLHLYVPDADAVYRKAIAAGADSLYEPVEQGYGDREAGVTDLAGNQWFIATHRGASYIPQGLRAVTPGMRVKGADKAIDFLEKAFGAQSAGTYRSPQGVVVHAKFRIGDSLIELGEAHGQWQPMATSFFLLVEDADAIYERALQAGAMSVEPPTKKPFGARVGTVLDPFGNQWFISMPVSKL